jgi:hypothetical protein
MDLAMYEHDVHYHWPRRMKAARYSVSFGVEEKDVRMISVA